MVGAIASSAPVQAKLDFDAYLKVVDDDLGKKCLGEIRSAMTEFTSLLSSSSGRREITRKLKLSPSLEGASKLDVSSLVNIFADAFAFATQYDDYQNTSIVTLCRKMFDSGNNTTALERLGEIVRKDQYLYYKYHLNIDKMKSDKWNGGKQSACQLKLLNLHKTHVYLIWFVFRSSLDVPNVHRVWLFSD